MVAPHTSNSNGGGLIRSATPNDGTCIVLVGVLLLDSLSRVSALDRLLRPARLVLQLLGELREVVPPLDRRRCRLLLPMTLLLHNDRSSLILLLCPWSQKGLLERIICL